MITNIFLCRLQYLSKSLSETFSILRFWHLICSTGAVVGLFASSVQAQKSPSSVNWQRIELQQKIKSDLVVTLTSLVGSDHFVVNVDIKLKKVIPRVKDKAPSKTFAAATNDGGMEGLLLSKLGVMVSSQHEEAQEIPQASQEESPDIFALIEKIRVNCLLDVSISNDRQEVIKKVIQSQFFQFDAKLVEVTLDKVILAVPPVEKKVEPEISQEKSFAKKFEPFTIPVSILLSFFTIMAMMLMLFRGLKPQPTAAPSSEATLGPKTQEDPPNEAAVMRTGHSNQVVSNQLPNAMDPDDVRLTVEKFRAVLKANENTVRLLTQEWVNSESSLAMAALRTLPKYLSLDEFTQVTGELNSTQKKKLKKSMASSSSDLPASSEIMEFIRSQLLMSLLTDSSELTEQHKAFLSSLKASEIAALATEEPGLVSGVINLVPSDLVAQTLNLLNEGLVEKILHLSLQFQIHTFTAQLATLETKITSIRQKSKVILVPVLDDVESLLAQVGPDKESHLFGALISSNAYTLVEDISKRYFPSDLVLKLEPKRLNAVILRMPLTKRAELIFSLNDADKATIFQAIGENGKLKELIDSEIESIQIDESRKLAVEMTRVLIWKQFVNLVREAVRSNPLVQQNAELVLKTWLDEKKAATGEKIENAA